MSNSGIYSIYWKLENGVISIDQPSIIAVPDQVKRLIAQKLIDELHIPITLQEEKASE